MQKTVVQFEGFPNMSKFLRKLCNFRTLCIIVSIYSSLSQEFVLNKLLSKMILFLHVSMISERNLKDLTLAAPC